MQEVRFTNGHLEASFAARETEKLGLSFSSAFVAKNGSLFEKRKKLVRVWTVLSACFGDNDDMIEEDDEDRSLKAMSRSISLPQILPAKAAPEEDDLLKNKLRLHAHVHQQDSNGSLQGILKDSGFDGGSYCADLIDDVDIIMNSGMMVQADFASGGSNSGVMLASEPQSEAAVSPAKHSAVSQRQQILKTPIVEAVIVSSKNGRQLVLDPFDKKLKDLRTLKQHYYPEGGWGWVILLVTLSVQMLVHGVQYGIAMYSTAAAATTSPAFVRRLFRSDEDISSGKIKKQRSISTFFNYFNAFLR